MNFIQPILNLGTLGSVSSGKSTGLLSLTGEKTQRHRSELVRNITIKAGYCNMKIYQDEDGNYKSSSGKKNFKDDRLVHHLSFVDCPGHQQLTQIMLGQVNLMAGALTVISMAENVSTNSQLIEHLKAAKLAGIEKNIVCLNKCDLVSKEVVTEKYHQTLKLFESIGLPEPLAVIPTSFNLNLNVDFLIKAIMKHFKPEDYSKDSEEKPFFSVSRSFDINRPGMDILKIKGGVLGGSLVSGKLNVGDNIVIKPGHIINRSGKISHIPIRTKIKSIMSEKTSLDSINPGGLMAIMTDINSHFTKSDRMVGNVICLEDDDTIEVVEELKLKITFINKSYKIKLKDKIKIQVGPKCLLGTVENFKNKFHTIKLAEPVCLKKGTKLYLATSDNKITIIGHATF